MCRRRSHGEKIGFSTADMLVLRERLDDAEAKSGSPITNEPPPHY